MCSIDSRTTAPVQNEGADVVHVQNEGEDVVHVQNVWGGYTDVVHVKLMLTNTGYIERWFH